MVEARHISDKITSNEIVTMYFSEKQHSIVNNLNSFGYDEGAKIVYGCTYSEWKKRYQRKATEAQLEKYNASKSLHAIHDKEILATRSQTINHGYEPTDPKSSQSTAKVCVPNQQNPLLSDVCCQEMDTMTPSEIETKSLSERKIVRPPTGSMQLTIGILTVSDRAAANAYESGDLSGPAVESTIRGIIDSLNVSFADQVLTVNSFEKGIVPDEEDQIKDKLLHWSGKSSSEGDGSNVCNLVFTTGGTGFSPRGKSSNYLDQLCQNHYC